MITRARTPRSTARPPRRAFTLVEVLVAIGAVALLAVGIAQIFSVIGKTVGAGRRLSNLTTFANVLERRLRADVESITRDGFIVVRHDVAAGGAAIALSPTDASPRRRRVDELQFFATGQFTSQREPVQPGRNARSSVARIYYGHGLQRDPNATDYTQPVALNDDNRAARGFGVAPTGGARNPNRYAADWILLRHVMLMQPPSTAVPDKTAPGGVNANELDSVTQVGMQPAVPDIFRARAATARAASNTIRGNVRPNPASGVIDVAAMDLAKVRAVVLGAEKNAPYDITNGFPVSGETRFDALGRMQDWMRNSLPADSDNGRRMRCEPAPPNLLGIGWANPQDYEKSDQAMLSASNFLARCSEFIVEWSFGQVQSDPGSADVGRVLWYGLQRQVDADGDGASDYLVRPYLDPASPLYLQVGVARNGGAFSWAANRALINARVNGTSVNDPIYSFFGFADPLWTPPTTGSYFNPPQSSLTTDVNRDGQYDPVAGDALLFPDTVPWAWPKMLRITVSIADQEDPNVEQTFQFIFSLPAQNTGSPM